MNEAQWRRRYKRTLASARWKRLRKRMYRRSRGCCQDCRGRFPLWLLDLHHLVYRDRWGSILGRERPRHVRMLCRACHAKADARRRAA